LASIFAGIENATDAMARRKMLSKMAS